MTKQRIEKLLNDIRSLNDEHFAIAQQLRQLALTTNPDVAEEIKYGGILFSVAGSPFCGIFSYAKHVSLEFTHGASLLDEYQCLEGSGQYRRHIKLHTVEDIAARHAGTFIASACDHALTNMF
ncbi:DUF1801 domain-containing protein [Allohahella marinimesophila]|uniref:YdhG-like domain-containing protein n=1 Tax=Allohahella marinimesophila TaxID=1054972 RepID=A0ABP7NFL1_9GAMM